MRGSAEADGFRLTVLNPGGRDREQRFEDGAGLPGAGHQPTNFHGYAACTRGSFHRNIERAVAEQTPVLLLLRGDFKESEIALREVHAAGRKVAVSLKETGLHQIADQLRDGNKLARFIRIIEAADGCIAATLEAADIYRLMRGHRARVAFIPTPYPIDDPQWNFARPIVERAGIYIGTRETNVLSRNHLAALFLARDLAAEAGDTVTVYNFDGRKGARMLSKLGFAAGKLEVRDRQLAYPEYLREIAKHKIVLQLDTSFVPGQVAGDALLCRVPCVGGNGAVDRLAFPDLCGLNRSIGEIRDIALRLLTDATAYEREVGALTARAREQLSFAVVAEQLRAFFAQL